MTDVHRAAHLTLLWALCMPAATAAQIATDGTVGASVELSGSDVRIGPELGLRSGGNLLHSFDRFSIDNGQTATFEGPGGINSVIARVTGGRGTRIDGLLRSTIPAADVFLVNPAGITFGPNGAINVPGAFHASTAERLVFEDGSSIRTDQAQAVTLTTAPVSAFGFLGTSSDIQLEDRADAELALTSGATLSLVGGRIVSSGSGSGDLRAAGGEVRIVAQQDAGEVPVAGPLAEATTGTIALIGGPLDSADEVTTFVDTSAGGNLRVSGGDVSLQQMGVDGGAVVTIEGQSLVELNRVEIQGAPEGGTNVRVASGGNLRINNASSINLDNLDTPEDTDLSVQATDELEISGFSFLNTATDGSGPAASIELSGRILTIDGGGATTTTRAGGSGGQISLSGERITLQSLGAVLASTLGESDGAGGDIEITASDELIVDGFNINVNSIGSGASATATLRADSITFLNGGNATSTVLRGGDGGAINVMAESLEIDGAGGGPFAQTGLRADSQSGATGAVSGINVSLTGDLTISNGGLISSRSFGMEAPAGTIDIDAANINMTAAANIRSDSYSAAAGGDIEIDASKSFSMRTYAPEIDGVSQTFISSYSYGSGRGGNIKITAPDIYVNRALITSAPRGTGDGGVVRVNADQLTFKNEGRIFNGPIPNYGYNPLPNTGRGGDIEVTANLLTIDATLDHNTNNATGIFSSSRSTTQGAPGNVTINVSDRLDMTQPLRFVGYNGNGALISTSTGNAMPGGVLRVDAGEISLRNGATISSDTSSLSASGPGGTVSVTANGALEMITVAPGQGNIAESSIRSTSTGAGDGGTLEVSAQRFLSDRGFIGASTQGSGDGGTVRLEAPEVTFLNEGRIFNGTSPPAYGTNTGNGGDVTVVADRLTIDAIVDHPALNHTGISSSAEPRSLGAPGDVTVTVGDRLELRNYRALINAETSSPMAGGAVRVVGGDILVENDAEIGASGFSSGAAGSVNVFADRLDVRNAGIRTSGQGAEGGRIDITSGSLISLDNGEITSSGIQAAEGASIVRIEAPAIVLENGSRVLSLFGDTPALPGDVQSGEASVIGIITRISDDSEIAAATSAEITGLEADVGNDLQVADPVIGTSRDLLAGGCDVGGQQAPSTFLSGASNRHVSPTGFLGMSDLAIESGCRDKSAKIE